MQRANPMWALHRTPLLAQRLVPFEQCSKWLLQLGRTRCNKLLLDHLYLTSTANKQKAKLTNDQSGARELLNSVMATNKRDLLCRGVPTKQRMAR